MAEAERIQLRGIVRDLDRFIERAVIKVTTDVTAELTRATPVDTGWARANWLPSLTQPRRQPAGQRSAAGVAQAVAEKAIGIARVLAYRVRHGVVYITNNVQYIQLLNEGHSGQAPSGFVQTAIVRALASFRRFRG